MQEYRIKIRETLEKVVTVEAMNLSHAKEVAEKNYKNSEYVLTADDYSGVTFQTLYPHNKEYER